MGCRKKIIVRGDESWQLLPTPKLLNPHPTQFQNFQKYPLFWKWKSKIENNTFQKNRSGRDYCVPNIKFHKKNQNPIMDKKNPELKIIYYEKIYP